MTAEKIAGLMVYVYVVSYPTLSVLWVPEFVAEPRAELDGHDGLAAKSAWM